MAETKKMFSYLRVPERTTKPRLNGFTMVEGDLHLAVVGMNWLEDFVTWGGSCVDYFKVGYTLMFQPRELVVEKLSLLKQHRIEPYPQGNCVEGAIRQACLDPFLDELQELGINIVEVSSTHLAMGIGQKASVIENAKRRGFTVFAEIGKKYIGDPDGPKTHMTPSQVIREMKDCLTAGAFKVIYEYTEVVSLLKQDGGLEGLLEVAGAIGADNIMFELPTSIVGTWKEVARYAALYVEHFGPNVNLGDLDPSHLLTVESMRLGLTNRAIGKVPVP